MILSKANWGGSSINLDTFNHEGTHLKNIKVNTHPHLSDVDHRWILGFVVGDQNALAGYIDDERRLHTRSVDLNGSLNSLDQVVSAELTGVGSISLAYGEDRYAVLFEADAAEGGEALYFVSMYSDGTPIHAPVRLTPSGVEIFSERPQILWDHDAWVLMWDDSREGLHFARGRFDCHE